ncbi:MAG: hypothetical protein K6B65_00070 [Bacilli bacterium]|nr:hypothetical protein [Bacilli bacterium]
MRLFVFDDGNLKQFHFPNLFGEAQKMHDILRFNLGKILKIALLKENERGEIGEFECIFGFLGNTKGEGQ